MELDIGVSPNQLRWYLDDALLFSLSAPSPTIDPATWTAATDHGFFLILDVAMGGSFPAVFGGGPTDATQPGAPMLVDYVKVYRSTTRPGPPTNFHFIR